MAPARMAKTARMAPCPDGKKMLAWSLPSGWLQSPGWQKIPSGWQKAVSHAATGLLPQSQSLPATGLLPPKSWLPTPSLAAPKPAPQPPSSYSFPQISAAILFSSKHISLVRGIRWF